MSPTPTHTAILLFARSARAEAQHKAFGNLNQRRRVSALLNRRAKTLAERTGLPVYHVDETQQRGDTFATRYQYAFQSLFDQGYDRVVAIGNDCPELSVEDLRSAVAGLEQYDLVIGPCRQSGGIYLMGIRRERWLRFATQDFPWQTRDLQQTLIRWTKQMRWSVLQLRPLSDANNLSQLLRAIRLARTLCDYTEILRWLGMLRTAVRFIKDCIFLTVIPCASISRRGPPV